MIFPSVVYVIGFWNIRGEYQPGEKMKHKREKETGMKEPELPNEVKLLQKELKKQQLHNHLLERIIKIANKETGTAWAAGILAILK